MKLYSLETSFSETLHAYTGRELRGHFLRETFGLRSSAIGAFVGPCDVKNPDLVDMEDRLSGTFIRAKSMLHFLGEFFDLTLLEGVFWQRLMVAMVQDELRKLCPAEVFERSGNDLFWKKNEQRRKLSVSIVTRTPLSALFHLGINIDSSGAPVLAAGLGDLGVDPRIFADRLLERFQGEWNSSLASCTKVRGMV